MANSQATSPEVAQLATQETTLPNTHPMLIGTFGNQADTGALLRLPSGRVHRVTAGDQIAGIRVTAIEHGMLHGQMRGRPITLNMPTD